MASGSTLGEEQLCGAISRRLRRPSPWSRSTSLPAAQAVKALTHDAA